MLSVWRITKQKHARSAFTGEGARLYGGRWNTPGTAIIYTAQSQALAVLEILVHLESPAILSAYLFFELLVEESLIQDIPITALPKNWRADPPPAETQTLGDDWVANATSAVLRVPSAIIPGESNFLLNPVHPDFRRLQIVKPTPFQLDPRLSKR
jgi:RES domain-containing protein